MKLNIFFMVLRGKSVPDTKIYLYHCFRHEDVYDMAKFLCLVNIFIGHDR